MKKKILALVVATLMIVSCAFGLTGCTGTGVYDKTLYVYTNAGFAPYEYIDTYGQVVGVDMDIMQEIGEVLGYNVVINDIDFNQILDEVQNNKMAVGAAGMTKTDARDAIALSSISYATSVQYVIAAKGTFTADDLTDGKLPLAKLEELTKKGIGVQEGTTGDFMVSDAVNGYEDEEGNHVTGELENKGLTVTTYTNAIVASQDIGTTLGAVVIDKLPAESICAANSNLECYELDAEPEAYVLYFNLEATELAEAVNAVLEKMISGGVIDFYTLKHSGGIVSAN